MIEYGILLTVVAITTALMFWLTRIVKGVPQKSIGQTLAEVMECLGLVVIFMIGNAVLCIVIILLVRVITSTFVSLYVVADLTLVALSAFQGLVFRFWWRSA